MMEINGVRYYHAAGAARLLGITRFQFYSNIRNKLVAYEHEGIGRKLYREVDLLPFMRVKPLAYN